MLVAAVTACDAGAGSVASAPVRLRSDTLPTLHVDWDRSTLVGGPDRLVVATARDPLAADHDQRFAVHEFDPVAWRWRRRPDAAGRPVVLRGALVAVSLRCSPADAYDNARCDVVGHTLSDGADRWSSRRLSAVGEWVHEGGGASVEAVGPEVAVMRVYRSTNVWYEARRDGFRRLPAPPSSQPRAPGGADPVYPVAHCVGDDRLLRITSFGSGHSFVSSLDLDLPAPRWTAARLIEGPAGEAVSAPLGCWGRHVLAFPVPRTVALTEAGWHPIAETGTPGVPNIFRPLVQTRTDLVLAGTSPEGASRFPRVGDARWLRDGEWRPLPADVVASADPRFAALGEHVVAAIAQPGGTRRFEVLRPSG